MPGLSRNARAFLETYGESEAEAAAERARELVSQVVNESGLVVHAVSARAKSPASLRAKLRRKSYTDPAKQITDIIGVRIITYYRDGLCSAMM